MARLTARSIGRPPVARGAAHLSAPRSVPASPRATGRLGRQSRAAGAPTRADRPHCDGAESLHFLIESEYEIAMREAESTWVLSLVELIRSSRAFTGTGKAFHTPRSRFGLKHARPPCQIARRC